MENRTDSAPSQGPAPASMDIGDRILTFARAQMLSQLAECGQACTVADVAEVTGQHQNTVREHLDALVRAGLATRTRAQPKGRGRPAWVYRACHSELLDGRAREYLGLASALAARIHQTSPEPQKEAVAAGEEWGRELVRQDSPAPGGPGGVAEEARWRVVDTFTDLGFAPEADRRALGALMTRCPLLEVAKRHPDVVCWVHLGLARAILGAHGGDPEQADIRPFARPGGCELILAQR